MYAMLPRPAAQGASAALTGKRWPCVRPGPMLSERTIDANEDELLSAQLAFVHKDSRQVVRHVRSDANLAADQVTVRAQGSAPRSAFLIEIKLN